jgi:hypothetical protein
MRRGEISAGYFGPDERPLFGWLHEPADARRAGVVIVPPFGYEAICAARSLRHFAEVSISTVPATVPAAISIRTASRTGSRASTRPAIS